MLCVREREKGGVWVGLWVRAAWLVRFWIGDGEGRYGLFREQVHMDG